MLFHFKIRVDIYQADKKKINGECNSRMLLYDGPGCFHFFTPVDIVEDEYGGRACMLENLGKVLQCGLFAVVAVDKGKINVTGLLQ